MNPLLTRLGKRKERDISSNRHTEDRLRLREDVRYRVIDQQAVILRLDAGKVHSLNEVGARILELLDGRRRLGEIVAKLEQEYEASEEVLKSDLYRLMDELLEADIVEEVPGS